MLSLPRGMLTPPSSLPTRKQIGHKSTHFRALGMYGLPSMRFVFWRLTAETAFEALAKGGLNPSKINHKDTTLCTGKTLDNRSGQGIEDI
jgi:hypothetical protein